MTIADAGLERRGGGGRLTVAVENRSERRIIQHAEGIARTLVREDPGLRIALVGIYPLESVFVTGPRSALYLNDPGQMLVDEHGRTSSPEELVRELYG